MFDTLFHLGPLYRPEALGAQIKSLIESHGADAFKKDDAIDLNVRAGPAAAMARAGYPIRVSDGRATVVLMGPMLRRAGPIARLFGFAGTDAVRFAIQSAIIDKGIDQIVMRVDSPGGAVSGVEELSKVVRESPKPVIAVVEGAAMSAAYYAISGASEIISGPSDLVGSIGTRIMLYDTSQAFAQAGIKPVPIDTGAFKSMGAPGTEITDEQKKHLQSIVDQHQTMFNQAIMVGRRKTAEAVEAVADGRFFTAQEGLALGLIDRIGGIEDVPAARSPKTVSAESRRRRLMI